MASRESYRDIVDRMFGELSGLERQSLLLAIQRLDEAAQSLGIDVVAELQEGHTLTDIFDLSTERQPKAISLRKKMPAVETIQSAGQMPMPCAVSWILRL